MAKASKTKKGARSKKAAAGKKTATVAARGRAKLAAAVKRRK